MTTPRGAPELVSAQALPETTVNEQIRRTEAGASYFPVADRVTAPPGTCVDGAVYLIIAAATGAFTGKENQLALAVGANAASGWFYRTVGTKDEGVTAWVQDENIEYRWNGSAWASIGATDLDDIADVNAPTPDDGDVLTWDDGAGEWIAAPAPGAGGGGTLPVGGTVGQVLVKQSGVDGDSDWEDPSGGGWSLVSTWTYASPVANVDFTNLSGYSDLLVVFRAVSQSSSGSLAIRVSTNNGSSFYSTLGDYVNIDNAGTETGPNSLNLISTNTTAAKSAVAILKATNVNGGPKFIERPNRASGDVTTLFVASTSPIDAIRALSSGGGNLGSGNIYVFGKP